MVASLSAPDAWGTERALVVEIREVVPEGPRAHDDSPHRFGLTSREREVAALLERRRNNREIARALRISAHTARRHTERVLAKLAVRSRGEVERVIRLAHAENGSRR